MTIEAPEIKDRRKRYFAQAMELLALENNTAPEAFTAEGLTLTTPAMPEGIRLYSHDMPFFKMATTGNSLVVSADARLHGLIKELYQELGDPHRLFEYKALKTIDESLREYGYALRGTFHMYLPGKPFPEFALPSGLTLQWFDGEEAIKAFYPNERFHMALSGEYNPDRPDVIALAAMDGEEIVAVSGASADTKDMWQVGIDVLPGYRGRGLGTALVSALCRAIEEKGKLPFYGTAVANLHSQKIAQNSGFYPAWIETGVYKL